MKHYSEIIKKVVNEKIGADLESSKINPACSTLKPTSMTKENSLNKLGRGAAIIALFLCMLAWIMQAYSLFNWENAVILGLQNGSFQGNELDIALATKEKGEAIADLIWVFPLNLLALIGVLKRRFFGFVSAMMVFAICIYFPLFYCFQIFNTYPSTVIGAVVLWAIPSLTGIWGLWINKNLYKN